MALVVKNLPANAGYMKWGSIPGLGRSPGGGNGDLLRYSYLENPMDRGAWRGYSLWGCKESDKSEQLNTHVYIFICEEKIV